MSKTKQFRKKPVVIDAIQWTGENLKEVIDFTGKHPKWDEWFSSWEDYETFVRNDRNVFKILTLEGAMEASVGDWIIRGIKGEHYPCKPDIFDATYEPADPSKELKSADWKSAKEYWKERFDEYPQNDAEKLAVAMMAEYAKDVIIPYSQLHPSPTPDVTEAVEFAEWCALHYEDVNVMTDKKADWVHIISREHFTTQQLYSLFKKQKQ